MKFFRYEKILFEKRLENVTIQVVQREDRRELRFGNHITQSAISVSDPDFLQLDYTRAMAAAFLFAPKAAKILHIGLGAGSLPRFIHRYFPLGRQQSVELSPEIIDVAYRFFFLPVSPRFEVFASEGSEFLAKSPDRFDLIFLDAFHAEGVDDHLKTIPFFGNLRDHLQPGGWLVNNVWGSDRANLKAVTQNMARVFPQMFSLSVRAESNVIFFAGLQEEGPEAESILKRAEKLALTLPIDFPALAKKLNRVQKRAAPRASITG